MSEAPETTFLEKLRASAVKPVAWTGEVKTDSAELGAVAVAIAKAEGRS